MAYKWLLKLEETYPHLAKRARELNMRDGYIMKYDPLEVEKRNREEEQRKLRNKEPYYKANNASFSPTAKRSKIDRVVSP